MSFAGRLQLSVAFGVDDGLSAGEKVVVRDVAEGVMQPFVVVMRDESLHDEVGIFLREWVSLWIASCLSVRCQRSILPFLWG